MPVISIVGLVAALCTTTAFLPQVIKVVKTKKTQDISLLMYLVLITGLVLWLIYGFSIKDLPLICGNAISLVLASIVLGYKIKFG